MLFNVRCIYIILYFNIFKGMYYYCYYCYCYCYYYDCCCYRCDMDKLKQSFSFKKYYLEYLQEFPKLTYNLDLLR